MEGVTSQKRLEEGRKIGRGCKRERPEKGRGWNKRTKRRRRKKGRRQERIWKIKISEKIWRRDT